MTQDERAPALVEDSALPADAGPRWPAWMAFFAAWLLPATSARLMAHVSLRKAFLVHLASAVLLWLLIDAGEAWESTSLSRPHGFGYLTSEVLSEMITEFYRDPVELAAVAGIAVFCVEGGYLALAALLSCWGAADERMRSSFRHALRCVWLLSPHVLPIAIVVFLVAVEMSSARRDWYTTVGQYNTPNKADFATTQAYVEAIQTYQNDWRTRLNQRPWYIRYDEVILGYIGFALSTWALWAMLRAIGSRRDLPRIDRPPMCEFCGYNLSMARLDGLCPECGQPVIASLGPAARPGPAWEHRDRLAVLRAWWRCSVDPILRPAAFGRQIQVRSPRTGHRWFLLTHMAMMSVIGYVGTLLIYALTGGNPFGDDRIGIEARWIAAPMTAYLTGAFALVFGMLAAGLVGLGFRFHAKRNLIPVAMRIACYLGGFGTLWAVFLIGVAAVIVPLADAGWFRQWQSVIRVHHEILGVGALIAPNLLMLAAYLYLLVKGTAAAKYANQ